VKSKEVKNEILATDYTDFGKKIMIMATCPTLIKAVILSAYVNANIGNSDGQAASRVTLLGSGKKVHRRNSR